MPNSETQGRNLTAGSTGITIVEQGIGQRIGNGITINRPGDNTINIPGGITVNTDGDITTVGGVTTSNFDNCGTCHLPMPAYRIVFNHQNNSSLPLCSRCEAGHTPDRCRYCGGTAGPETMNGSRLNTTISLLCDTCFDNNYITTESGVECRKEAAILHEGVWYTNHEFHNKFRKCSRCLQLHIVNSIRHHGADGTYICQGCRHENEYECANCSRLHNNPSLDICERCEDFGCPNIIQPYDYKPDTIYFKYPDDNTKLMFGVEFEYNAFKNHYTKKKLIAFRDSMNGFFYFKEDGSLNQGVEIVTHPFTEKRYQDNRDKIISMLGYIGSSGGETGKNTGIHIHISRLGLTTDQMEDIYFFFNLKSNQRFIEKIAGRKQNNWFKYHCKGEDERDIEYQDNKYEAVNLRPEDTIEIRVFRSALKPYLALGRIEFTMCMVKWVKQITNRHLSSHLKYTDFLEFAKPQRHMYPNLIKLLHSKGLMGNESNTEGDRTFTERV